MRTTRLASSCCCCIWSCCALSLYIYIQLHGISKRQQNWSSSFGTRIIDECNLFFSIHLVGYLCSHLGRPPNRNYWQGNNRRIGKWYLRDSVPGRTIVKQKRTTQERDSFHHASEKDGTACISECVYWSFFERETRRKTLVACPRLLPCYSVDYL